MAKFSECSEAERIVYLKDEFVKTIELLMVDPNQLKSLIPEGNFKVASEFIPSIRQKDCQPECGTCIDMTKLESRIPPELECLVEIARKKCEERAY